MSNFAGLNYCEVCHHPMRGAIDLYLSKGNDLIVGAAMFPPLTWGQLQKHREDHVKGMVVQPDGDPVRVLRHLQTLSDLSMSVVRELYEAKEFKRIGIAIQTALACSKTEAEITGLKKRLNPRDLLPHWHELQRKILVALEDFPEAKRKLLTVLDPDETDQTEH